MYACIYVYIYIYIHIVSSQVEDSTIISPTIISEKDLDVFQTNTLPEGVKLNVVPETQSCFLKLQFVKL